jgi:hypothetical protein
MRTKVLFAVLLLSATTAFAQQEKLGSGIDKTNMDLTIKPGNDFYRYAAGNWMKNHPLDAEHTDNGAFTDLFEQNQKRIQDIILEYASKPQQKGSLGQKIGSLYNLRMDSVRLNKEGWAPIKPTLDRIAAIKDRREYQLVTAQLDFRGEGTMMYGIGVGADLRDADAHLKVGHIRSHHHARHTDKSDARNRRTHHTESNHIPRRTAVGTIESFITCHFTGSKMTEEQQHTEVCQNCDNDSHILLDLNKNKKPPRSLSKVSAVRTRLELVTSCVTGRHSNQLN